MATTRIEDETEGRAFLYSSGTTGRPKGVKHELSGEQLDDTDESHDSLRYVCGNPSEGDLLYSPAPLYHAAPLHFCMSMHRFGCGCVIPDRFDAENSLRLIERYRCGYGLWVPTMFARLLRLPAEVRVGYDVSCVQAAIHGAALCAVKIKQAMIDWFGPVLLEYYGATEGNGVCLISSKEALLRPGSVGKAVMGEVHILDENENDVPPYTDGTVYFGGDRLFSYFKDEEKTAQSRSRQGVDHAGRYRPCR
jgi:long-chain acyl-CoA synthetase